MKMFRAGVLLTIAVSVSVYGASWTDSYHPQSGEASPFSVEAVSARGFRFSTTNADFSVSVGSITNEGLFRVNLDPAGWSGGFGNISIGMPSDSGSPALQIGGGVSFAGRADSRDWWDFSWLGLETSGDVTVDSGAMSVKSLTLPDGTAHLVKRGTGTLAVGAVCAGVKDVSVENGTLRVGQANVGASAPAANPVVWLAADMLRDEDLSIEDGTTYLKRWFDARGANVPEKADGISVLPMALPMNTNKTVVSVRGNGGKFPFVVAGALNGLPVVDFGEAWFAKNSDADGCRWEETTSAFMALADSQGACYSDTGSTFAKEGFIVVAQNSEYDVPVMWTGTANHLIHSGYGNVRLHSPGGDESILNIANSARQAAFGLWSVDAIPVSAVSADSFKTRSFKNNSYHLISFKTSDAGRINPNLLASDRYCQNGNGGVRIAEVIYYYRELTDSERTQTQKYLMEKWGLGAHPATADVALKKLEVASGATFGYVGDGTLSVADASVSGGVCAKSGTLSLTNDIAYGAVLHLDAAASGTLDTVVVGDDVFVRSWRDVRSNGFVAYSVTNTAESAENTEEFFVRNIAPYINVRSLPVYSFATLGGKTMPCVDFGSLYKSENAAGESETAATMLFNRTVSFKEGYVVFYDNNVYDSNQRMTVWGLRNREPSDSGKNYDLTLVRGSALTLFSNGNSLLAKNGKISLIALDGQISTLETVPERKMFHQYTLSLNEATDLIRSFGRDTDNRFGGVKICEAIAFSENLPEERRLKIERYLMEKWFGEEHPSKDRICEDAVESVAVAAGATVAVAGDLRMAPGGSLSFGVGGNGIVGRLIVSGKMSFAGAQNVTVSSQKPGLEPGDYVLAESGGMEAVDVSGWTVRFEGFGARDAKLQVDNGRIVLRIQRRGLVLLLQ